MRRPFTLISFSAVLVAVLFIASQVAVPAIAQEGTPITESHPIVGSWIVDVDTNSRSDLPELAVFSADRAFFQVDAGGFTSGVGVWEATGPNSVNLTFLNPTASSGELIGTAKVRATVLVDETGNRFDSEYTVELVLPNGASSGELGPGVASGTRIEVEPMGTPVGTIPQEEATPST